MPSQVELKPDYPKVGNKVFIVRYRKWEYDKELHKDLECMKCSVTKSDEAGNFIAELNGDVFRVTPEDTDWFWTREKALLYREKIIKNNLWDKVK